MEVMKVICDSIDDNFDINIRYTSESWSYNASKFQDKCAFKINLMEDYVILIM